VGDDLLQQMAGRLQVAVREGDTVARLGGDEFVLVLENLSANHHEAAARAEAVASKVLSLLAEPCRLQDKPHVTTTSVGIAMFVEDSKSYDDLLKEADAALYQAKAAGRNTFCFFDPAMQAKAVERSQMEEEIRRGLQAQEFVLFYQLQVDPNGDSLGVEALIRWQHPERGMVSPVHFIPLAEETGLILPMGQWVLESACQQLALWAQDPGTAHLTIAVNVSATQFAQANFVALVGQALASSSAPPGRLKLELTESILAANVEDLVLKMSALRQQGVSFSLDDFGTGYSSLAYLKRLPLQQLKIDQGFVRDLLTDPNDATIAHTIISLGHSLGLMVIAEGVEDEGQRQALAAMGCDAYQGYYFGKPVPAKDLQAGLRSKRQAV
jgi:predicted signal transduction protein with EAL and GGDEF domain